MLKYLKKVIVIVYTEETLALLYEGKNVDWGYLRTGCWREHLDLRRMKLQDAGGNCMMRGFIIFNLHQILLWWLYQVRWRMHAGRWKICSIIAGKPATRNHSWDYFRFLVSPPPKNPTKYKVSYFQNKFLTETGQRT